MPSKHGYVVRVLIARRYHNDQPTREWNVAILYEDGYERLERVENDMMARSRQARLAGDFGLTPIYGDGGVYAQNPFALRDAIKANLNIENRGTASRLRRE